MLILRVILLLIFLLPVNGLANGPSQPPIPISTKQDNQQPPEGGSEQPYKNKNTGESLKTPTKQQISQPQNQKTEANATQEHNWYGTFLDHPEMWLLVLFNGLLAFFTLGLWVSTKRLWKESQEHSSHMEDSIVISKEAADAAKKSAEVAIITQRSFISLKDMTINNITDSTKQVTGWSFFANLENSGNTAATDMGLSIGYKFDSPPLPGEYSVGPKIRTLGGRSTRVIGPLEIPIIDLMCL